MYLYFYVTKYKKFTDWISNSTLQVNFKKVPLWSSGVVAKENQQLSEKNTKICLPYPVS